ncbi:DNA mismatch repair protein [Takifugu flavidus]|uniref:DNA mismatch repair protein n=1 Tax=Takifugu flavidus TaxID=433684 RepID=A0A5C6NXY0_9TELE|nr:DNA mismatch repair protein [Takifugu flavidus]
MDTAIKCLPVEVQGKLRSGVTIPSLQQCVEELILNSIDAEATCVGVRMDMEAFKVQVIDNGNGMDADSMDCVGNRYHTSKCYRVEDLDNLSWYGFRGEALASLVSLATLVEISSRTKSSLKTHVKIFKDGKGMEVYEAEKSRPSAGTTVVLCNFFYNMPVRRKRLDPVLEGERIRHRVEAISLMHPSVSFTLKNDCTATMLVQLPKAKNTYHRFVQIHGLHRAQKLGEVNFTHGRFSVVGHIGREGHYNNSSQFLYVNERLLLKTRIHKLINFLLRKPSTNQKNDGGEQSVGSPKNKRSQELHGVPEPVPGCSANFQLSEKEERTTAGDWLLHYDTSLGKMVSVNKVTGLSRYEDQPQEETEVQCTSDITNMAVNVISEMGMEYKCYPFQRDLVLPFVPKSRSARVINARLDGKGTNGSSFNSLTTLYSKWNNPVFVRPPTVGLDISRQQADGLTVKIHNVLYPYRFSKAMIHSMKADLLLLFQQSFCLIMVVIHQVDKKFLACLISTKDSQTTDFPDSEDSYEDDPAAPGERRLCSSSILPPLEISVTEEELRLFRSFQPHLQRLGLEVKFPQAEEPQILVGKVPVCFTEKESNELRRGRLSVIRPIVEVRQIQTNCSPFIKLLRSTGRVRGTLPLTVLKVLASLACHGAIKFNDSLSKDECHSLVASLSSCQLPFQCAHGRPSIAPLVDILHLDKDQKELQRPNLQKLRRMYKAWQLYGNK